MRGRTIYGSFVQCVRHIIRCSFTTKSVQDSLHLLGLGELTLQDGDLLQRFTIPTA
jgi:hypothetical protein